MRHGDHHAIQLELELRRQPLAQRGIVDIPVDRVDGRAESFELLERSSARDVPRMHDEIRTPQPLHACAGEAAPRTWKMRIGDHRDVHRRKTSHAAPADAFRLRARRATHGLVLSLLNPLHVARTVAVATLSGVRLGGAAMRAAGSVAAELADGAIGVLRARRDDFAGEGYTPSAEPPTPRTPVREPPEKAPPRRRPRAPAGEPPAPSRHAVAPTTSPAFADTDTSPAVTDRDTRPRVADTDTSPRDADTDTSQRERSAPEASAQVNGAPRSELAPEHVSEEATLVAASADSGAEDGAGAEVEVEQPWPGYTKMRASDIVERLVAEPEAVLSVVLLYERVHRARRTVLDAAERELSRRTAAAGPHS
jgi:hypothetical protein